MKKHKRLLLPVFIILAVFLAACNPNPSSVTFSLGASSSAEIPHLTQDTAVLVKTSAELESLCAETFYKDGPFAPEHRETKYLRNLAADFGESYFTDNALVVYIFTYSASGWLTRLESLHLQDSTLTLKVEHLRPLSASAQTTIWWTYLIKVKKSDVKTATQVVIDSYEGINVHV